MLKQTHYPFGAAWWLAGTAIIDIASASNGAPPPIGVTDALVGSVIAASFADGWNSPDVDRMWDDGPPRRGYHWAGHRGFTHRVWFAALLTLITATTAHSLTDHAVSVLTPAVLAWAPVTGWWSHLAGDLIYGRLKIAGVIVGLGLETGGLSERGRLFGRKVLPFAPATWLASTAVTLLVAAHIAYGVQGWTMVTWAT